MRIVFTGEDAKLAERCLEVYMGDYAPEEQYAAAIMLHMLLKDEKYHWLMNQVREATGFRVNDRNSGKVNSWKKRVKRVGKCEVCGVKDNLEAHHKIPWVYSIKGRTDVNNGQCLCAACHKMMHDDQLWIEYMKKVRQSE